MADPGRFYSFRGSCLCRANAFSYNGHLPAGITCCQCSQCRTQGSIAGGGGLGVLAVLSSGLVWERGNVLAREGGTATEYFSTPGQKARVFCAICGTGLYSYRPDKPDVVRLRVGTVETGSDLDGFAVAHRIFVAPDEEVPVWARLTGDDGAKRWPGVEEGRL